MMKFTLFATLCLVVFSVGCSQKSGFFAKDINQQSAVMNTQKGQLYNSMEIKASIVSTYLNATRSEYKDSKEELFLISIFIDNDSSDPKNHGIYNKEYRLTLNGYKPSTIKKLDFEDDLIKIAPIRNRWSVYYLVGFPKQNSDKMVMKFKNDAYGEVVLKFQKEF